jgi:hypothetical protein
MDEDEMYEENENELEHGRGKRKFMPSPGK